MMIALCGCMMQEPDVVEKIKKSYRFVDLIFGTHNIFKLAELVLCLDRGPGGQKQGKAKMVVDVWKDTDQIVEDLPVERKYPFQVRESILCSAAIISAATALYPMSGAGSAAAGRRRSFGRLRSLAADGVVEIMLLGQNVNSYGKNLEQSHDLCAASGGSGEDRRN